MSGFGTTKLGNRGTYLAYDGMTMYFSSRLNAENEAMKHEGAKVSANNYAVSEFESEKYGIPFGSDRFMIRMPSTNANEGE